MHRCFLIPEIREHILSGLTKKYDELDGSSLLSAAQTCWTLSETALDIMWSHQTSLSNLMMCLPEDSWDLAQFNDDTDEDDGGYELSITRTLVPEDWARVQVYSRRIKHLTLRFSGKNDQWIWPTPAALRAFSRYRISGALLPSLRELHLAETVDGYMIILNSFISSNLRELRVEYLVSSPPPEMIPFLLSDVARLSPQITSLTLNLPQDQPWPLALPHILGHIRDLRVVSVQLSEQSSARALVTWLALLPKLTRLSLQNVTLPAPSITEVFGLTDKFKQLRRLEIEPRSLTGATAVLAGLNPASIDNLLVAVDHGCKIATVGHIRAFIKAILYACSASIDALECYISPGYNLDRHLEKELLSFDVIKPLFTFRLLERVFLCFKPPPMIDDEQVEELAKAWPHLRHLYLGFPFAFEGVPPRLTIGCLTSFTRHCRSLEQLQVHLDARALPTSLSEGPATVVCCESLRTLDVCFSSISDPEAVAAFLSKIFPKLRTVSAHGNSEIKEKWEDVSRRLEIIGTVAGRREDA